MREYGPGNPLVFSHIPKTAGTALHAALRAALRPEVDVTGLDLSLFGGYDDLDALRPAARARIFTAPDELPANATLVGGHISPWTTSARYPGADHITVLRVPHVRLLSQWLHSRSVTEFDLRHFGPAAEAFRIGQRPLREYLRHDMIAPNVDNTITRFLVWPHPLVPKLDFIAESSDDELLGAALGRLDSFAYADVVENASFLTGLGTWLGRELPAVQSNERTSVPPRMRPDLSAELDDSTRRLLDHRCRIDVRVWEHVVRQALPGRDPARLMSEAVDGAIARYDAMLRRPDDRPALRRVVARAYELGRRVRPR